jgi:hypothetical protein
MDGNMLALSLIFLIVCSLISWCLWLVSRHILRSRAMKAQTLLQNKLIDKLVSSQEILEYVNGESGRSFGTISADVPRNPFDRILETGKTGIIALCLGVACAALHWVDQSTITKEVFLILAILLLGLGIGSVLSALVSYFLSRSWGLLDRDSIQR